MDTERPKVVVAGDVAIDWLQYPVEHARQPGGVCKSTPNWIGYRNTNMVATPGGAMLLANMVRAATGAEVLTYKLRGINSIPPNRVIHANALLGKYPASSAKKDEKNLVYRIAKFNGYAGPKDGWPRTLPFTSDASGARLVVFDDAGNGFRDDETRWSPILDANPKATVLLKMSIPLAEGKLWQALVEKHSDRLVVVIGASHLRECGVNISRCLSWERTALDFVWQMASNSEVNALAACRNLIVRFGSDAAIHYSRRDDGGAQSALYYDPKLVEDGVAAEYPGAVYGQACAFTASLAASIVTDGLASLGDGIRNGIASSRRLHRIGFGTPPAIPSFPLKEVLPKPGKDAPLIAAVAIPKPTPGSGSDTPWTILGEKAKTHLEAVAYRMVIEGSDPLLEQVPIARFGGLTVIDRTEIESYQSIRNLMVEYVANPAPERPLSIAVFGPPGAGKSFGVAQLAESIAPGKIEKIEFNVSQFESSDLIYALHKVRDIVLAGKIPLVFFDEFDSQLEGNKLGWLKYFLMPMQDGKFKHGESTHPIGKAIFVFAGGTSQKFSQFYRNDPAEDDSKRKEFVDAKGPDFVSRLRGYVNILGPNPVSGDDHFFTIRRAMLLRFMLQKYAGQIMGEDGKARIDPGVLSALIKVGRYRHGVRSLLAIIDMSRLSDRKVFEQSALPPKDQLELHVEAVAFSRLLLQRVLFGEALERIAQAIHENYLAKFGAGLAADNRASKPWDGLDDDLKDSNRGQASHFEAKLKAIECAYEPAEGSASPEVVFTEEEIETMAIMEHERWMEEARAKGIKKCGKKKDLRLGTHPCYKPWPDLKEEDKEKDRDSAREIPNILAMAGFRVYRLP